MMANLNKNERHGLSALQMGLSAAALFLAMLAGSGAEASTAARSTEAVADNLETIEIAVKVLKVQQYENRMPSANKFINDAEPVSLVAREPRFVTLIEFETEVCSDVTEDDFRIVVQKKASGPQRAHISLESTSSNYQAGCSGEKSLQTFTVSSRDLSAERPVTFSNPVPVERLGPVD